MSVTKICIFYRLIVWFQIKLDITRQILNLGLPVEFSATKTIPSQCQDQASTPPKTAESTPKRLASPRKPASSGSRCNTRSPSKETLLPMPGISCDNISSSSEGFKNTQSSPVKGIKILNKKPCLKPVQPDLHLNQSFKSDGLLTGEYQGSFSFMLYFLFYLN